MINNSKKKTASFNLAALARSKTTTAIEIISRIMVDPAASHADQLKAASIILDRGHGRAVNVNIDSDFETQFGDLSDDELNEQARSIIGFIQDSGGTAQETSKKLLH
jgi:hypothetical protein